MQTHRPHPERYDSAGATVGTGGIGRCGRPGEQEASGRCAGIDLSPNRIPDLWKLLPFIQKDGAGGQRRKGEVGPDNLALSGSSRYRAASARRRAVSVFADTFGSVDRDRRSGRQEFVKLSVDGAQQIVHTPMVAGMRAAYTTIHGIDTVLFTNLLHDYLRIPVYAMAQTWRFAHSAGAGLATLDRKSAARYPSVRVCTVRQGDS